MPTATATRRPARRNTRKALNHAILPGGVKRAIHVFTPSLQDRLKNGGDQPVMAVRSGLHNYEKMRLYRKVDILGPSEMVELFDNPLPGTNGRGVAILFTDHALRVWFEGDRQPPIIDTADKSAEAVVEAVKRAAR